MTLKQRWEMGLRSFYKRCRFWHKKNIFSDEAHLDLDGYVQNYRIWRTGNLNAYIEKPTHPKPVTLWCGFWSRGIIGPFFFENEQVVAVIVNGDRYRAMLKQYLFIKIEKEDIGNIWFQKATQPKLHSMFCGLFLKNALSASELMSWGYLYYL